MAYDLINGYQPRTFDQLKAEMLAEVNEQFDENYDENSIVGTNHYKFFYGGIQLVMRAEAQFSEITARLTDYIRTSNEKINLPKSTINGFTAGLLAPESEGGLGLKSTIKDIINPDEAGYLFLVVDVDSEAGDYASTKQEIIDRMHAWLTTGLYYVGAETGERVAINGQVFTYAYDLPTPVNILVRITVRVSANFKTPVLNANQIRVIFNTNFEKFYRIGLNFEPEKYLEIARDAPFASDILLEYSEDSGSTWSDQPRAMAYNEKIIITSPPTVSVV